MFNLQKSSRPFVVSFMEQRAQPTLNTLKEIVFEF